MSSVLQILALVAMVSVAIVLLFGLWNMMKGDNANRSQKLMRLRVIAQAVAVVLVVAALYFAQ